MMTSHLDFGGVCIKDPISRISSLIAHFPPHSAAHLVWHHSGCVGEVRVSGGWVGVSARTLFAPQRGYMSRHLCQPKAALIRGQLNK